MDRFRRSDQVGELCTYIILGFLTLIMVVPKEEKCQSSQASLLGGNGPKGAALDCTGAGFGSIRLQVGVGKMRLEREAHSFDTSIVVAQGVWTGNRRLIG